MRGKRLEPVGDGQRPPEPLRDGGQHLDIRERPFGGHQLGPAMDAQQRDQFGLRRARPAVGLNSTSVMSDGRTDEGAPRHRPEKC